jgi:hypothetical protein
MQGWKTDRGRIYITYGPPDEIDSHPSGGAYITPNGDTTSTYPFEDWRYRYIEGIGKDINIEFVDKAMNGEYHMTMDPNEKGGTYVAPPGAAQIHPAADRIVIGDLLHVQVADEARKTYFRSGR